MRNRKFSDPGYEDDYEHEDEGAARERDERERAEDDAFRRARERSLFPQESDRVQEFLIGSRVVSWVKR